MSALLEFSQGVSVYLHSLALQVGTKGSSNIGSFLPPQPEPAQVIDRGLEESWLTTRGVQVFDSQDQSSLIGAGSLLAFPKRFGVAQVQVAGRRRRQSAAIRFLWNHE